jgi:O-antigen ligase
MLITIFIIGICFVLLGRLRPELVPAGVALILPAYQLRAELGPLPITALEMALIGSIVGGYHLWKKNTLSTLRTSWGMMSIALLLIGTVSMLTSPDLRAAAGIWKAYIIEPILWYWVYAAVMQKKQSERWLVRMMAALLLALGSVAALQYAGILSSPEPWISEIPRRVTSFFDFPNAVGLLAAPLISFFTAIIWLPQLRARWSSLELACFRLAVLAGLIAVICANARGALLGYAAALVLIAVLHPRRWYALAAIVLIGGSALLIPHIRDTAVEVVTFRDTSTDVRLALWEGSWSLLRANPLTGAGLAGFAEHYPKYKLDRHVEALEYPHNIFLNFWSELGLAGLLWIIVAIALLKKNAWDILRKKSTQPLVHAALAAFIAIVIYGLVDVPYFKNDLSVLWWVLIAFL